MKCYEYGDGNAPIVLLQPVEDHDLNMLQNEITFIQERTSKDFRLIGFKVRDWNKDLSPWKAPAVFGADGFGDGG